VLKDTDEIFGLELCSSVFKKPATLWLVRDKKGRIWELSKRRIRPLRNNKKKNGIIPISTAKTEIVDGEECTTFYKEPEYANLK